MGVFVLDSTYFFSETRKNDNSSGEALLEVFYGSNSFFQHTVVKDFTLFPRVGSLLLGLFEKF
jgi:hypothetical protein